MSAKIKRRKFITLLGGAAAAWPLAAHALATACAASSPDPQPAAGVGDRSLGKT